MGLAAGTRLGPYEVVGPLGAGGMGEVYRARDPRIGRDVAVKVLPPAFAVEPDRLHRFQQEARAIGALNHPNLLALYDVGSSDAGPYLVSELLEGESLRDRLRGGPIPLRDALDWGAQIARGLSAAHERGIVHRDLKPENVFLLRDGRVKILDFGLAKFHAPFDPSAAHTVTAPLATSAGAMLGTVGYMAPEQVRGEAVGPGADIFALGALLYELVAGRSAFRRATSIETLNAILNEKPAPLSSAPAGVERVIFRCLEKDHENRFRSSADVAFALAALSHEPPPQHRFIARPVLFAGTAAALVALVGVWWLATRGRDERTAQSSAVALRMTPFLSSEAIEMQPAWSPTGDLIAYVSDAAGNDDIWIADPSGGNPVNVTQTFTGIDEWPAWSRDGRRLAFYSERDGGGIYTMTALGADVRRVVPLKSGILYTFSLSWSGDGSLLYTGFDAGGVKRIYRVAATGGDPACITCGWTTVSGSRAGQVSPSGTLLAFLSGVVGPRADLYVAHLPSGRVRTVTNRADMPRWSPDGRQILFISDRDGQADLWQFAIDPADGSPVGEARKLTSALGATAFTVASDGRQILAVKEESTSHIWSFPLSSSAATEVGAGTQLTSGDVRDRRGRWSADGRSIFFESVRRGSSDIWRMESTGTGLARLTTAEGSELRPRPSPQGDWVAVDIIDSRGEFTHLMRPDGSQVHALDERWFSRYSQVCCADWSPDGARLAAVVTTREPISTTIAVTSVDRASGTATATRLLTTLSGGTPQYGRWSPDGRFIVYEAVTDGSWDLWIADPDARESRRLTTFSGNDRQAVWQSRPRALYFFRDFRELWRMPFDDHGAPAGEATRWLLPPGRSRLYSDSLDVHPSNDRLLVTLGAPASDIWLVELK